MRNDELQDIVLQVLTSRIQGDGHCAHFFDESRIKVLIKSVTQHFLAQPTLLRLDGPIHVVGDIHGDLYTLTRLFQCFGYPPSARYLFLGDYVDRGKYSAEVLIYLYALMLLFPNHIHLLRGNHESKHATRAFNFRDDCIIKLSRKIYLRFVRSFAVMPLAGLINNSVFCVHGGLSPTLTSLQSIDDIERPLALEGDPADLLWSDPSRKIDYFEDSPRGVGFLYGEEALGLFLKENGLSAFLRGHESCKHGFLHNFGKDVPFITVFSSENYCNKGNEAAVAVVGLDNSITPILVPSEPKRMLYPEFLLQASLNKADILSLDMDLELPVESVFMV